MIGIGILLCLTFVASSPTIESNSIIKTTVSEDEIKLYELIMDYREDSGLDKIPLSNSLTIVAQTHCKDLFENKPDLKKECNTHSWSDKGKWTSCCYTIDHKESNCMWNKPRELTSYLGDGYEIAVGSSDPIYKDFVVTPQYALNGWKKSVHHNNVIINKHIWKEFKWNAIGVGIYKGFAIVWFGSELDPEGEPINKNK